MSGTGKAPSLHIEWSPNGRVVALDTATGRSATGAGFADITSVTAGHKEALVGIARNSVFLKTVGMPKVARADLRRILGVQVGQLFPLPANQLAFDFIPTTDPTTDGFLTMVASVRAEDVRVLTAELKRAGLEASRILPVALGAVAVAARVGKPEALVVEETPVGLTLDVVKSGTVIFSRIIPVGGDARREAQRTLAAAGVGDVPIIAAGGLVLGLDAISEPATALRLLHETPADFTFELEEDRLQRTQKRVAARTRLGALMMASALLLVGLLWVERSDAQAVVTRGQGTWTRELSKLRSIRDLETAQAQKATEVQSVVKTAFEPAQPLSDIAAVVGDCLPGNSWLNGLNAERGKPVQIRGTSSDPTDVARFLKALADSGRFRDVRLVVANSAKISETPVVQFSVTAIATGNMPMPAPKKATGKKAAPKTDKSDAAPATGTGAGEKAS